MAASRSVIRQYARNDEEAVVELSLRAWAPVFASLEEALGGEVFGRLHPDWRADQAQAVRDALASEDTRLWVAEAEGRVVGFVAAALHEERQLGEITMLAVDPEAQRAGIGTALSDHATDWLRASGMRVAMVETGGDPGHAPARRVYEKAGYAPLPVARFFKPL